MRSARNYLALLFVLFICLSSFGCHGSVAKSDAGSDAEKSASAPRSSARQDSGLVELEEGEVASVRVEEVQEQMLPSSLSATGKVQFNEDRMARILAPVSGQVQQLAVKIGDVVEHGQTLFSISSREVAAAFTEHRGNHKDMALAEKTYVMTKALFEHEAASRRALDEAESDLAKAKARVAQTEEALRVLGFDVSGDDSGGAPNSRIPVKAALGGKVIERAVTEGQFVQADSNALLIIADLSTVWVLADIFERDLHLIQVGQRAEVTTAAYPDQRFVANVSRINDVVDPATRTVKVRFLVSNQGGRLKPEMFASVTLFLHRTEPALTLPAQAVFTEGDRNYIFVSEGERRFKRREVQIQPDAPGRLRVTSGLKAGEKVISEGVLLVRQLQMQQGA